MRVGQGKTQRWIEDVALNHHEDTCLLWPFAVSKNGYPQTWEIGAGDTGGQRNAHRLICERAHGPPPSAGYEAAHSCGVKTCVATQHLRWATRSENQADRALHGTLLVNQGSVHGMAKLTDEEVLDIRRHDEAVTNRRLAAQFGVSPSLISMIRNRKIWRHL